MAAVDAGETVDPSRLALETALLVDKMDVHEEVVRLQEHVKACLELIQASDAKGKKLDFYCQELLREVNTIGSTVAAGDADSSRGGSQSRSSKNFANRCRT